MDDRRLITGLLLAVTTAPAVAASDEPGSHGPLVAFTRIDSDSNGYVSRVEARPVVASESFMLLDANDDGLLSEDEYTALRSARTAGAPQGER